MDTAPPSAPMCFMVRSLAYGAHLSACVILVMATIWMLWGSCLILDHWPPAGDRSGRIVLVATVVDDQDDGSDAVWCMGNGPNEHIWSITHLEVGSVIAGEFPHERLKCLEHLPVMNGDTMFGIFSLRIELGWSFELGMYRVLDYRAATAPRTFLVVFLPGLIAVGLAIGTRRLTRWAHRGR